MQQTKTCTAAHGAPSSCLCSKCHQPWTRPVSLRASAPDVSSFGVDRSTDQMGPLLLQIEDSSNFISRKLLPICDSSGVPKEKVAVRLCLAGASLPCRSLWLFVTPAGKARQGVVILAAWQLYVSVFLHPSTRALPQGPARMCCDPLGLTSRQSIAPWCRLSWLATNMFAALLLVRVVLHEHTAGYPPFSAVEWMVLQAFLIGADSSGSSGIGKAICQRAEDVNADVVVASRHSKEVLAEGIMGSTSVYLARRCTKPLVLLP